MGKHLISQYHAIVQDDHTYLVVCMGSHEKEYLLSEQDQRAEAVEIYTRDGSVDVNGDPAIKSKTGNWRASSFIVGTECCERLAYYGIATNLVTYLRTKLHEGNVSAARNVNIWSGTSLLTPLIGAVLADSYWGRYHTIAVFSIIYFIGIFTLTLSGSLPALNPPECSDSVCPSATPLQLGVFFSGLYLVALGTGGIKPCVSFFGADQFDDTDRTERVKKGSFFNWFFFFVNIGAVVSGSLLVNIEENAGWGLGYGITLICMGLGVGFFFLGTRLYRFQRPGGSPLTRICQVIVSVFRKRNVPVPADASLLFETAAADGCRKIGHTDEFRCLDKACVVTEADKNGNALSWRLCTVTQVEELKIFVRMAPIWATSILFVHAYSQMSTTFILQGAVMDRTLGSYTIPSASLSTFEVINVLCWVPVYDMVIVPLAKKLTGNESGISILQRMGIGLFVSCMAMAAAALVEIRRLRIAAEMGLTGQNVAVPMSVFWQLPQYSLVGASTVFFLIGEMQFNYDQSPDGMRSLSRAWWLLAASLGYYFSSFVLTMVTYLTTRNGGMGWIPNNLNEGHLDYYFWLLAMIGVANLGTFILCSRSYTLKKIV